MKRVQNKGSQSISETNISQDDGSDYAVGRVGFRESLDILKAYNKKKGNVRRLSQTSW